MACLFYKQKTAYEMRISDWSSDVCSSDLARTTPPKRSTSGKWTYGVAASFAVLVMIILGVALLLPGGDENEVDRKSVVSGKSVSVRVDLGGRRIIKKKNA